MGRHPARFQSDSWAKKTSEWTPRVAMKKNEGKGKWIWRDHERKYGASGSKLRMMKVSGLGCGGSLHGMA